MGLSMITGGLLGAFFNAYYMLLGVDLFGFGSMLILKEPILPRGEPNGL